MYFEQNSGMTVMATTNEAIIESPNESASAEKRNLLTPKRKTTGRKSTTSTSVAASTARLTSAPPCSAATAGDEPISRWRKMFSSEMTELSMTRENASAMPPRIIVFTVLPIKERTTKVASAESGIDRNTAKVARMLPRKIRIIKEVSARPSSPSWSTVRMASLTNADWSKTTAAFNWLGMSSSFPIISRMPLTTSIVLVSPPCFMMGR